jgi:hypothetical protein
MITLLADHRFGTGQHGNKLLAHGWAAPEEGFVWAIGRDCMLVLPPAEGPGRLVLELTVAPFKHPPSLRHQRLRVSVNGTVVGDRRLGGELAWWLEVPASAAAGKLHVRLHQPQATPPAALGAGQDDRLLGFRLSAAKLLRMRSLPAPAHGVTPHRFGWNETTEGWLEQGFAEPEDGFVWALGRRSVLRVPVEGSGQPVLAALDMRPFLDPPHLEWQRLMVGQDGRLLTYLDLHVRTLVALRLTPKPGQRSVLLQFDHMNAEAAPATIRHDSGLPFAYALDNLCLFPAPPPHAAASRARIEGRLADGSMAENVYASTGLALSQLATRFVSFGNGCSFALMQRQLGSDHPALLRFAGCWQPSLARALLRGFAGLGRPDALRVDTYIPGEATWRMTDEVYGFSIPTPYDPRVPPPGDAVARAGRTLPRLAEKLLEDAASGDRIFVYRAQQPIPKDGAAALRAVLGALGDVTLLWLTEGTEPQRGTVERAGHRLLHGYARAVDGPDEEIVSVMANAWILAEEECANATGTRPAAMP